MMQKYLANQSTGLPEGESRFSPANVFDTNQVPSQSPLNGLRIYTDIILKSQPVDDRNVDDPLL
jgi:hypothetical protein